MFRELGTPPTNAHYVASTAGAMYGTAKVRSQVGPFAYRTGTPFRGLYLCGASTLSHGVAGAAHSGLLAARAVTGLEVPELLRDGEPEITLLPAGGRAGGGGQPETPAAAGL